MAYLIEQRLFNPRSEEMISSEPGLDDPTVKAFIGDFSKLQKRTEHQGQTTEALLPDGNEQSGSSALLQSHTDLDNTRDLVAPLRKRMPEPLTRRAVHSFSPLAEWEGYVSAIEGDKFYANLVNVRESSGIAEEEAEFQLRDLTESEQSEIAEGSILRWVIGYERLPNDGRRRVSHIHLRRLPAHSASEIEQAIAESRKLSAEIDWDESS